MTSLSEALHSWVGVSVNKIKLFSWNQRFDLILGQAGPENSPNADASHLWLQAIQTEVLIRSSGNRQVKARCCADCRSRWCTLNTFMRKLPHLSSCASKRLRFYNNANTDLDLGLFVHSGAVWSSMLLPAASCCFLQLPAAPGAPGAPCNFLHIPTSSCSSLQLPVVSCIFLQLLHTPVACAQVLDQASCTFDQASVTGKPLRHFLVWSNLLKLLLFLDSCFSWFACHFPECLTAWFILWIMFFW